MWLTGVAQAFGNHLYTFITWLGDFVRDSKTGKPSVKRYGLALAVTVLCGIMAGMGTAITILTASADSQSQIEIIRIVCNLLENLAFMVLTAVTTGYLVDRTQERKMGSQQNQQTDNPAG